MTFNPLKEITNKNIKNKKGKKYTEVEKGYVTEDDDMVVLDVVDFVYKTDESFIIEDLDDEIRNLR